MALTLKQVKLKTLHWLSFPIYTAQINVITMRNNFAHKKRLAFFEMWRNKSILRSKFIVAYVINTLSLNPYQTLQEA